MKTSARPRFLLALAAVIAVAACSGGGASTSQVSQPGGGTGNTGGDTTDDDTAARPGRGEPCPDGACADDLECVTYYGIAGPSGPAFTSCETPCDKDPGACPDGTSCTTIADGPGQVCR